MRMRSALAASLVLLSSIAAAQDEPQSQEDLGPPIVVTGIRIQDYRDRLAACLARQCPPNEDIDASLALAEALFLEGEYDEARQAVRSSLRRNRRHRRDYPEPVSDLHRAHARLSRHLGFDRDALRSTHDILNTLQAGIETEDYRHFTARMELSEIQMMMGRHNAAERELDALERRAQDAGREDVVTLVALRRLWFEWLADPRGRARTRLMEMAASTDPARRMETIGARILLARIYLSEGDRERADPLLAEIGRGQSWRRRLIYSPSYQVYASASAADDDEFDDIGEATRFGNTLNRLPPNYEGKWVDVGFWVLPDGRVSGVEILRRGADSAWAAPILRAIAGRQYSTADEATYRLERYTLTAGFQDGAGSRIRTRSSRARVEYFDLTIENPPPPPPSRDDD